MEADDQRRAAPLTPTAARELFDDSRRLYDAACLVARHGPRTMAPSAPLFKRSLHTLLTLVAKLDPEREPPRNFEDTVRRAQDLSDARKICPYEFASRVLFIGAVSDRFFDLADEMSPEDARKYDYDVDWLPDLYRDVWRFTVAALTTPADAARVRRRNRVLRAVLGAAVLLGAAYLIHRRLVPRGLKGSYFRDAYFRTLAYESRDDRIDFAWGRGGPRGLPSDLFGVRWDGRFEAPDSGTYVFNLTSDDGSRLYVDGSLAIDGWEARGPMSMDQEVGLRRGVHRIRVEYFELQHDAYVTLSWSGPSFARRVMSGGDFR